MRRVPGSRKKKKKDAFCQGSIGGPAGIDKNGIGKRSKKWQGDFTIFTILPYRDDDGLIFPEMMEYNHFKDLPVLGKKRRRC